MFKNFKAIPSVIKKIKESIANKRVLNKFVEHKTFAGIGEEDTSLTMYEGRAIQWRILSMIYVDNQKEALDSNTNIPCYGEGINKFRRKNYFNIKIYHQPNQHAI